MMRGACAVAALLCAQPVLASTAPITAYYVDPALIGYTYPGPAQAVISVPVKASVGGSCGFATGQAPNATVFNPNIDTTGWGNNVPFVAECTAPWRIAVSSQNGALKSTATTATGYINRAPYDVAVTGTCPVAQVDQALGSSSCNFKGTATPGNGLLVPRSFGLAGSYIRVSAPAYPGPDVLVEGTYNDTLIVTISPAT
jgi:hypothetical protein